MWYVGTFSRRRVYPERCKLSRTCSDVCRLPVSLRKGTHGFNASAHAPAAYTALTNSWKTIRQWPAAWTFSWNTKALSLDRTAVDEVFFLDRDQTVIANRQAMLVNVGILYLCARAPRNRLERSPQRRRGRRGRRRTAGRKRSHYRNSITRAAVATDLKRARYRRSGHRPSHKRVQNLRRLMHLLERKRRLCGPRFLQVCSCGTSMRDAPPLKGTRVQATNDSSLELRARPPCAAWTKSSSNTLEIPLKRQRWARGRMRCRRVHQRGPDHE